MELRRECQKSESRRVKPPETRHAKSGDAHIAYQVCGAGSPIDLVLVPGFPRPGILPACPRAAEGLGGRVRTLSRPARSARGLEGNRGASPDDAGKSEQSG